MSRRRPASYSRRSSCSSGRSDRSQALAHILECIEIMDATGSRDLKLWFADGTNYPGQDSVRARQDRLAEALRATYDALGDGERLLLEYKLFEPAFYSTDVPDWGTAYAHCVALGPKAAVVIDTGHHAPGTNIEFIVAFLLREGRLGAFDFNSRFYADDDLMVGAADPFQLFRIMHEIVSADALGAEAGIAFMLDQCHNIEPKIPAIIRSVMNVQEATAKALLVDTDALTAAQLEGDVLGANTVLMDAYATDVRPLLRELREEMGLDPDPLAAYARSGYAERIIDERRGGQQAGWGS
jgi:L-rhamnose isomerase / sugar isomerase